MSVQTLLIALHTATSVIAVGAGFTCLFLDREISPLTTAGQVYVWATVIVCLTGFGIFPRGGFEALHALALMTLIVLGAAWLASYGLLFGRASPYVETVSYSLTFFFHMIPGLTETFTRLPSGMPYFSSREDPDIHRIVGLFFVLFLVGAALQVRRLRNELRD